MGTSNTQILQELGKMSGVIEAMHEDVTTMNRFMLGDGQPGALERLTRSEEQLSRLSEEFTRIGAQMDQNTRDMAQLLFMIEQYKGHITDPKQHIRLDKKTLSALLGCISLVYLFFEYVPFKEAFAGLLKLLGL